MAHHNKRKQHRNDNSKQIHETGARRGKTRVAKSRLVLVLHLIGWEGGARFLNQSQWRSKAEAENALTHTYLTQPEIRQRSQAKSKAQNKSNSGLL